LASEKVYTSPKFLSNAPLKAYFDFTNRCNLKCKHCITASSPDVDTSAELPTSRILEIVTEFAEFGVLEIAVGGGEPLFHPEWRTIFHHITASGINLIVTTNSLLLTPESIDTLKQIGLLEIRVSFDGGPTLHEHIRGSKTYEKALAGLAELLRAGLNTTARLTLCQGADTELSILFRDLSQIGARNVKVAVVKEAGRAATSVGKHLLGYEVTQQTVEKLKVLGRDNDLQVQISADDFPVSIDDANDPKLRDVERANCGAGFETCYISSQGQVLGCVTLANFGFGQLHTVSFMEIWQNKIAQDYRCKATGSGNRRICDALCTRSQ
jgi:MoaA/NifB/PqqE/SkfB family radical SAM enzyme